MAINSDRPIEMGTATATMRCWSTAPLTKSPTAGLPVATASDSADRPLGVATGGIAFPSG